MEEAHSRGMNNPSFSNTPPLLGAGSGVTVMAMGKAVLT